MIHGHDVLKVSSITASGGMFKQHGKAHTVRKLSHCNIELIQKVFCKSGITLDVVKRLQQIKNQPIEKTIAVGPNI